MIASVDNVVVCGGSVLRKTSDYLLGHKNIKYHFAIRHICLFALFLVVFGRFKTKDFALKYRSNLYKGKNVSSYRFGNAVHIYRKEEAQRC